MTVAFLCSFCAVNCFLQRDEAGKKISEEYKKKLEQYHKDNDTKTLIDDLHEQVYSHCYSTDIIFCRPVCNSLNKY